MGEKFQFICNQSIKTKLIFSFSLIVVGVGIYFLYNFLQRDPFQARFPIVFNSSQLPQTEVTIEGVNYLLKIDLGASEPFALTSDILENIQKTYSREIHSYDFRGNEYCSKVYVVPEIKVRNLKAYDFEVREESFDFLTKGSILYGEPAENATHRQGTIGRPIFQDINLFLDFHNAVVFSCRHLRDRKKEGYQIDQFVSLPIEQNLQNEIILKITTDAGVRRFMVDTGSTKSLIKPSAIENLPRQKWRDDLEIWPSSQLIFGKKDFGKLDFLVFPMDEKLSRLDGVIGMDFLKEHVVYFDFKKKMAYVAKSEECFPKR